MRLVLKIASMACGGLVAIAVGTAGWLLVLPYAVTVRIWLIETNETCLPAICPDITVAIGIIGASIFLGLLAGGNIWWRLQRIRCPQS